MNLGATVRDGLKNLLGIRSPSRVFAELGGFLGEGLSHGMRASLGEVQKAAAAMAGAATIALAPPALAATNRSPPPMPKVGPGAAPGAPMQITFAPHITVNGAATPEAARAQVTQAVQLGFAEFERLMRRYDAERRRIGWEGTT
jgi:hypothetical protein